MSSPKLSFLQDDVGAKFANEVLLVIKASSGDCALNESVVEKIQGLNALMQYECNTTEYAERKPLDALISEIGTVLTHKFILNSISEPVPQCVYKLLAICISSSGSSLDLFDILGIGINSDNSSGMNAMLYGENTYLNCINFLDFLFLHEEFPASCRINLIRELGNNLFQRNFDHMESPTLSRIATMICTGLDSINDEGQEIHNFIWKSAHDALMNYGRLITEFSNSSIQIRVKSSENEAVIHYCLVLIDLLLQLSTTFMTKQSKLVNDSLEESDLDKIFELFKSPLMWIVIQSGLYHRKSLCRKRALFVLRKIISLFQLCERSCEFFLTNSTNDSFHLSRHPVPVFHWDCAREDELLRMWKEVLLIAETLEENQVHVISPVLKRLEFIFSCTDQKMLHTLWVCALLQRMFLHESKAVIQEGVIQCLSIDPVTFPFLHQETGENLLCSSNVGLIPALQDVGLFCDFRDSTVENSTPAVPKIASMLKSFLHDCVNAHDHPETLLHFLLTSIAQQNWGSVPLYYLCLALSNLPSTSAWTGKDLLSVRILMTESVRTHDTRLRYAIQTLLIKLMMSFVDCSSIDMKEILKVILLHDMKKSFFNCNILSEVSTWLFGNMNKFQGMQHMKSDNKYMIVMSKFEQYISSSEESQTIVLLIILILISDNQDSKEFVAALFTRICEITDKASTHLYMPKEKILQAISVLENLLTWYSFKNSAGDSMWKWLVKIVHGLLSYVTMCCQSSSFDMTELTFCLGTARKIMMCLDHICPVSHPWQREMGAIVTPLIQSSLHVYFSKELPELQPLMMSAKCLSWSCLLLQDTTLSFDNKAMLYLREFLIRLDVSATKLKRSLDNDFGKTVERYAVLIWSCIPYALGHLQKNVVGANLLPALDPLAILKRFPEMLDIITENNLAIYFEALQALVAEVLNEKSDQAELLVCDSFTSGWRVVGSLKHSPAFWHVYKKFIQATFQTCTLYLPSTSLVQQKLKELLAEISSLSSAKPGLLQYASKICITAWMANVTPSEIVTKHDHHEENRIFKSTRSRIAVGKDVPKMLHSQAMGVHADFIVDSLSFCHLSRKDDLALSNALSLEELQNPVSDEHESTFDVALSTIAMLMELDVNSVDDCELGYRIFKCLLQLDESIRKVKSKYHQNSVHHHIKNKIYQAAVLLIPFVPESDAELVVKDIIGKLKNDAQHSVRYLMEWALVLLLLKFPVCDHILFANLNGCDSEDGLPDTGGTAKFSALCSYLTAALLLGVSRASASKTAQDDYFLLLANTCIPWCMSQHFTIRLYALAILLKIKMIFEQSGKIDILLHVQPALLSCFILADKASGNVGRNWIKIKLYMLDGSSELLLPIKHVHRLYAQGAQAQDNFFLFSFDPVLDLSMETIYCCLPRLCLFPSFVRPDYLRQIRNDFLTGDNYVFKTGVSLFNERDVLREKTTTKWVPQQSKTPENLFSNDERYRKNYKDGDGVSSEIADNVQKKITPWLETLKESDTQATSQAGSSKGLVLVASLIDKASNLGGLTRTCEIFGAETLVVQSLSCTNDKVYQSLAVTAQKWLHMFEVKPWQLEPYLLSMRSKGYTLIGTEQTAQSMCLSKYKFPERCVVVLGNEKEGIPIPILKILDVCVQIPQKGIVRSLNVHVSGAITVWEYARQHLNDKHAN